MPAGMLHPHPDCLLRWFLPVLQTEPRICASNGWVHGAGEALHKQCQRGLLCPNHVTFMRTRGILLEVLEEGSSVGTLLTHLAEQLQGAIASC